MLSMPGLPVETWGKRAFCHSEGGVVKAWGEVETGGPGPPCLKELRQPGQ